MFYRKNDYDRLSGKHGLNEGDRFASAFDKDVARLKHSNAFRRLCGKTQLFPHTESDFFRNRLTHSLEVAQIAKGIAHHLNKQMSNDGIGDGNPLINYDLVEFAGLAHDLGHPPFGHNGEKALDDCMKRFGGFEGNAQTIQSLVSLERKREGEEGLDITCRSLAAVLKYDRQISHERTQEKKLEKGYYSSCAKEIEKAKKKVAPGWRDSLKTVECQIMDLADDIAYSTYDLEDCFKGGFLTPLHAISIAWTRPEITQAIMDKTNKTLSEWEYDVTNAPEVVEHLKQVFFGDIATEIATASKKHGALEGAALTYRVSADVAEVGGQRKEFTSGLVGDFIRSIKIHSDDSKPAAVWKVSIARDALCKIEILKHLTFEWVTQSPNLLVAEYRGYGLICELFEALSGHKIEDISGSVVAEIMKNDPLCGTTRRLNPEKIRKSLMPRDWQERYEKENNINEVRAMRVICDYIAGMTDRYAIEFYSRLKFGSISVFKPV